MKTEALKELISDYAERISESENFLAQAENGSIGLSTVTNGVHQNEMPGLVERERAGLASMKAVLKHAREQLAYANRT
jgi:hypothetical protein